MLYSNHSNTLYVFISIPPFLFTDLPYVSSYTLWSDLRTITLVLEDSYEKLNEVLNVWRNLSTGCLCCLSVQWHIGDKVRSPFIITCRKQWLRKTGSPTSIIVEAVFKNQEDVRSHTFRYFENRDPHINAQEMWMFPCQQRPSIKSTLQSYLLL